MYIKTIHILNFKSISQRTADQKNNKSNRSNATLVELDDFIYQISRIQ